jgi:SagB-type dehydrogenase family enzyme
MQMTGVMRRNLLTALILFCAFGIQAQELKPVRLTPPNKMRGSTVMKALNDRRSIREYTDELLRPQDLSDLLWAANGINRPDGKRTAPSCRNLQDVEIYVITAAGAYLYEAGDHSLKPVAAGDHRKAVAAGQDFAKSAPVSIVLVADMTKYGNMSEQSKMMAAVDVGIVCQNICIACSGLGLATVPRATMDMAMLKTVLKLTEQHLLLMNNPVGYPK